MLLIKILSHRRKPRKIIYPQTPTSLAHNHRQTDGKSPFYINLPLVAPEKEQGNSGKKLKPQNKSFFKRGNYTPNNYSYIFISESSITEGQLQNQQYLRFRLPKATNTESISPFLYLHTYLGPAKWHRMDFWWNCFSKRIPPTYCKSHGNYRLHTSIYPSII